MRQQAASDITIHRAHDGSYLSIGLHREPLKAADPLLMMKLEEGLDRILTHWGFELGPVDLPIPSLSGNVLRVTDESGLYRLNLFDRMGLQHTNGPLIGATKLVDILSETVTPIGTEPSLSLRRLKRRARTLEAFNDEPIKLAPQVNSPREVSSTSGPSSEAVQRPDYFRFFLRKQWTAYVNSFQSLKCVNDTIEVVYSRGVMALNIRSGQCCWQRTGHPIAGFHQHRLILSDDTKVQRLGEDGSIQWNWSDASDISGQLIVRDLTTLFALGEDRVEAFDIHNGSRLWRTTALTTTPIYFHVTKQHLLGITEGRFCLQLCKTTGKVVKRVLMPFLPLGGQASQRSYLVWGRNPTDTLASIVLFRGALVPKWTFVTAGQHGRPPRIFDCLVVLTIKEEGRFRIIGLDGATGTTLWQVTSTDRFAPVVRDTPQGILVQWSFALWWLDSQTGEQVKQMAFAPLAANEMGPRPLAIFDNTIVMASGTLDVYSAKDGEWLGSSSDATAWPRKIITHEDTLLVLDEEGIAAYAKGGFLRAV